MVADEDEPIITVCGCVFSKTTSPTWWIKGRAKAQPGPMDATPLVGLRGLSAECWRPARTAEPAEMPFFEGGIRVGPRNHDLDGGPVPQPEGALWGTCTQHPFGPKHVQFYAAKCNQLHTTRALCRGITLLLYAIGCIQQWYVWCG